MTPLEIVHRLVEIADVDGSRLQQAAGLPGDWGGCILMTAIGCDVLTTFGLQAEPYPVTIFGENAAYRAWSAGLMTDVGSARASKPADAHAFADKGFYEAVHGTEGLDPSHEGELRGHLVIHLPVLQVLVDLDLRQFSQPDRGIDLPATFCIEWPPGRSGAKCELPGGGQFLIRYSSEDYGSRKLSLEFSDARARLVPPIVRAILTGIPLTAADLAKPLT